MAGHVAPLSELDCHCVVQVPVPPEGVAVKVIVPPVQTVVVGTVIVTTGSAIIVTLAEADVSGLQPKPPEEETIT
jgi:hypothetical protein